MSWDWAGAVTGGSCDLGSSLPYLPMECQSQELCGRRGLVRAQDIISGWHCGQMSFTSAHGASEALASHSQAVISDPSQPRVW